MAGSGRVLKLPGQRRTRHKPIRGEWQSTSSVGWQHGPIPDAPDGLAEASVAAWHAWFGAWWATHWDPADLPGLRVVVRLYDQVERGDWTRAGELRLWADTYGITPKGQQDRRWTRPAPHEELPAPVDDDASGPYGHLRTIEP